MLGAEVVGIGRNSTDDLSALALGLSQLVAMLEAFEAANSSFSYDLRAVAWDVPGSGLPVSRLKPTGLVKGFPPVNPQKRDNADKFRAKVYRRIDEIANERYMEGYHDAAAGKPPRKPIFNFE